MREQTANQKKLIALAHLGIAGSILNDEMTIYTEAPIPSDAELLQMYEDIQVKEAGEAERKIKEQAAKEKATQLTVAKLVKAGQLADAEILDMVYLYPAWTPAAEYKTGDMVEYNAKLYEVVKDCIGDEKQKPADTATIFVSKMPVTVEASK